MDLQRHSRLLLTAVVAISVSLIGCDKQFEKPPVEVLQRESLLGAGKIIQIKSTTNEDLAEIEVTIKAEGREVRHTERQLAGYQTVEIGWKKLDGWQIPDDAEIEVRVKGYAFPVRADLTPGGTDEESR